MLAILSVGVRIRIGSPLQFIAVVGGLLLGTSALHAQPQVERHGALAVTCPSGSMAEDFSECLRMSSRTEEGRNETFGETQSVVLRDRASTGAAAQKGESAGPRFGDALLGSTVGVAVGTGLGIMLLEGASQQEQKDRWDLLSGRRDSEEAVATLRLAGIACIVVGGPIGAVEGAGIRKDRTDAYVGAVVGEFVFGTLGYALGGRLHDNAVPRLLWLGAGTAVGAAGGAVLFAPGPERMGFLNYRESTWQVAVPDVRMEPSLTRDQSTSVSVTLVSARL